MMGGVEPPLSIEVNVQGLDREGVRAAVVSSIPARPGVVVLERDGSAAGAAAEPDAAARTVQVVATGDLRSAVLRRLVEAGETQADLFGIVSRVRACVCGSGLEADAAYLAIARERAPRTYRAAADRWRAWFIHLDPEGEQPVWRKTDLHDLIGDAPPPGAVIGPMGTKDAAARYGRALDELYSLCREPRLLAQRPNAQACSYKQMGACPAPCDGSEPMAAYRERVRAAVAFAGRDARQEAEAAAALMREAAARMDFEAAAELRVRGEVLRGLGTPALARVTTLDRLNLVAVQPAGRAGFARLLWLRRGEIVWLADVSGRDDGWVEGVAGRVLGEAAAVSAAAVTRAAAEAIGLMCSRLFRPGRGAGSVLSVTVGEAGGPAGRRAGGEGAGDFSGALWRAARKAARVETESEAEGAGEAEAGG